MLLKNNPLKQNNYPQKNNNKKSPAIHTVQQWECASMLCAMPDTFGNFVKLLKSIYLVQIYVLFKTFSANSFLLTGRHFYEKVPWCVKQPHLPVRCINCLSGLSNENNSVKKSILFIYLKSSLRKINLDSRNAKYCCDVSMFLFKKSSFPFKSNVKRVYYTMLYMYDVLHGYGPSFRMDVFNFTLCSSVEIQLF